MARNHDDECQQCGRVRDDVQRRSCGHRLCDECNDEDCVRCESYGRYV